MILSVYIYYGFVHSTKPNIVSSSIFLTRLTIFILNLNSPWIFEMVSRGEKWDLCWGKYKLPFRGITIYKWYSRNIFSQSLLEQSLQGVWWYYLGPSALKHPKKHTTLSILWESRSYIKHSIFMILFTPWQLKNILWQRDSEWRINSRWDLLGVKKNLGVKKTQTSWILVSSYNTNV